jgi:hypothetical protein
MAIAVALAWALPQARAVVGIGAAAGVLLAVAWIARRRATDEEKSQSAPLNLRE